MRRYLMTLAFLAPATVQAESPIADVICAPKDRMEQRLTQQMGTRRSAMGLRGPEQVMEVWTDARDNWTLVISYASGQSCIVAMGENWQGLERDPA